MKKQVIFCVICLAVLVVMLFSVVASAEIFIGVKEGDSVEYNVTAIGNVPEEHDVDKAKIEVVDVEVNRIFIKLTSIFQDGSEETEDSILDLEMGHIGDAFIIPANLSEGDTFLKQTEGTITISGVEQKTYAGSERTVVTATTTYTEFYWDQTTGLLVEATSTYTDFTITTQAEKTNIWPTTTIGLDQIVTIVLLAMAVAVIFSVLLRRK